MRAKIVCFSPSCYLVFVYLVIISRQIIRIKVVPDIGIYPASPSVRSPQYLRSLKKAMASIRWYKKLKFLYQRYTLEMEWGVKSLPIFYSVRKSRWKLRRKFFAN